MVGDSTFGRSATNGINEWGNVLTFRFFFTIKVCCIVSVWWLLVRYFVATAQFVSGGFLLKYSRYHDNGMWSSSFLHFHCSLAWPKISFPLKLPPTRSPLTRDALYEQQLGQLRADCDGDIISHTDTSLEVLKSRFFLCWNSIVSVNHIYATFVACVNVRAQMYGSVLNASRILRLITSWNLSWK